MKLVSFLKFFASFFVMALPHFIFIFCICLSFTPICRRFVCFHNLPADSYLFRCTFVTSPSANVAIMSTSSFLSLVVSSLCVAKRVFIFITFFLSFILQPQRPKHDIHHGFSQLIFPVTNDKITDDDKNQLNTQQEN